MKDKKSTYHQKKESNYWWFKIILISYKNGIPKYYKLARHRPDNVPRFITKKCIEVHDQSGNAENRYNASKQTRFKASMLRSDLCDFSDA